MSKPSNLCDHYQCLCDMILLLIRDSMGCLFTEVLRRSDCVAGSMECGIFANRPRLIPVDPVSSHVNHVISFVLVNSGWISFWKAVDGWIVNREWVFFWRRMVLHQDRSTQKRTVQSLLKFWMFPCALSICGWEPGFGLISHWTPSVTTWIYMGCSALTQNLMVHWAFTKPLSQEQHQTLTQSSSEKRVWRSGEEWRYSTSKRNLPPLFPDVSRENAAGQIAPRSKWFLPSGKLT